MTASTRAAVWSPSSSVHAPPAGAALPGALDHHGHVGEAGRPVEVGQLGSVGLDPAGELAEPEPDEAGLTGPAGPSELAQEELALGLGLVQLGPNGGVGSVTSRLLCWRERTWARRESWARAASRRPDGMLRSKVAWADDESPDDTWELCTTPPRRSVTLTTWSATVATESVGVARVSEAPRSTRRGAAASVVAPAPPERALEGERRGLFRGGRVAEQGAGVGVDIADSETVELVE